MAIIITDECINCDACISECPNNAIYEPDTKWSYSDGSALKGMVKTPSGSFLSGISTIEISSLMLA